MDCRLCGKPRLPNRPKYCSKKCVKSAWYIRNSKCHSLVKNDPQFWNSTTGIGFRWEIWAATYLKAKHNVFSKGCDLEKDGVLIDVKSSHLYRRKNKRGKPVLGEQQGVWVFQRNKEKPCDFFFCIALSKEDKIEKKLLIPSSVFPKKGCVIGKKSKYDVYSV